MTIKPRSTTPNTNSIRTIMHRGFTIVELLIVVVVIAILATITVIAYNGITQQAEESALKSELRTSTTQLEANKVVTGSYPTDTEAFMAAAQIEGDSEGNYLYALLDDGYCLTVMRPTGKAYTYNSAADTTEPGYCVEACVTEVLNSLEYAPHSTGTGIVMNFSWGACAMDSPLPAMALFYRTDPNDSEFHFFATVTNGYLRTTLLETSDFCTGIGLKLVWGDRVALRWFENQC